MVTTEMTTNSPVEKPAEAKPHSEGASKKRSLFKDPVPWLLLILAFSLDQLSKAVVIANLGRGESWPEDGFFRITYVWNTGTAFSLFQGQGGPLTVFSFVAVFALYFVYRSLESPTLLVRMAFGLLLGGALGNLTDRIRLGHVTDFIDVGPWPIFNIADSSIVVGIAVLFFYFWVSSGKEKGKKGVEAESVAGGTSQDQPGGG